MTSRSDTGIVIRSLVEVVPTGDFYHEYWLVKSPLRRKQLSRHEADDYIREHGLVETLNCKHGQVWDTPERTFQNKYRDYFKDHYIEMRHLWG